MKQVRIYFATFLAGTLAFTTAEAQKNVNLPDVVLLATGGTIAGTAASSTQAGYSSGKLGVDAMLNAVPDAKKIANLSGEQISNVGSQDMTFEIMMKVAKRVN